MKIKSILLSATIFAFIGCGTGGTTPQGAVGNGLPNDGMLKIPQHNEGQEEANQQITIDGIWYVFYDKKSNNQINLQKVSELLKFDNQGKVFDISNGQEKEIANYQPTSDTKLKLSGANGAVNILEFKEIANAEGNCFYSTRFFSNNTKQDELWCKKVGTSSGYQSQGSDTRPQQLSPEGIEADLKDYFYPGISVGGRTSEDVYNYEKNQDGTLVYNGTIVKHFKKVIDPQNNQVIQEFINDKVQPNKEDIIYANTIDSYSGLAKESYRRKVQKNSFVTSVSSDGIDLRCSIKEITGGYKDLSSEIPAAIQKHLKDRVTGSTFKEDQFKYLGVVHLYCGTTSGDTIDSYYVNGWGEALTIYNYADNTSRYEILDKKSVQPY